MPHGGFGMRGSIITGALTMTVVTGSEYPATADEKIDMLDFSVLVADWLIQ